MDNLGNSNNPPIDDTDKPIPFDDGSGEPTPAAGKPANSSPGVSRAPLNLGGGGGSAPAPARRPVAKPAPRPVAKPAPRAASPQSVARQPVGVPGLGSGERITSCKVFFAKLHAGALDFLSDQISAWLKENPSIQIKHTNVAVGDVQAKKTEPNILITVWY